MLIWSHSSSVNVRQCEADDRQKLHQFKRKGKTATSPLWFSIVPNQSCLLQWFVLSLFSVLLIRLSATCFQDMDNYLLVYCCWPVLRGCLYPLLSFKVGAYVSFMWFRMCFFFYCCMLKLTSWLHLCFLWFCLEMATLGSFHTRQLNHENKTFVLKYQKTGLKQRVCYNNQISICETVVICLCLMLCQTGHHRIRIQGL